MSFSVRQIEIINTATELIHSGGIQNVTTKNIAKEIGFTEPSIYRHFKNKTEILQSIILHYKSQFKQKMDNLDESKLNAKEILQETLMLQFSLFSKSPAIATVIFSEGSFQNDSSLSMIVKTTVLAKKKKVISIIEKGQQNGTIRKDLDAETLAALYIGSIRFTLLDWRLNNCKDDLLAKGKKLIEGMNNWM